MTRAWRKWEKCVAGVAVSRCKQILKAFPEPSIKPQLTEFAEDFGSAYNSMSNDPLYDSRRCGEAYTLRWHPARTDNFLLILEKNPWIWDKLLPGVIDIGSGTGATSSALLLYANSANYESSPAVRLVEPNPSMRIMSRLITSKLQSEYGENYARTEFHQASTLRELILCTEDIREDCSFVFHHTFPVLRAQELERVRFQVRATTERVAPGSLCVFISPNKKVPQLAEIVEEIVSAGYSIRVHEHIHNKRMRSSLLGKHSEPQPSIDALHNIHNIITSHGCISQLRLNDTGCLPWFGSYFTYWILERN